MNKTKGPDGISAKFTKMSTDIIDCHLADSITKDISPKKFSEDAKTAAVRLVFKKGVLFMGIVFMGSLDVESLFTNIPLNETLDICVFLSIRTWGIC